MSHVTFTLTDGKRVWFNISAISAITECDPQEQRTLLEVRSGKDFFIRANFDSVVQNIEAKEPKAI